MNDSRRNFLRKTITGALVLGAGLPALGATDDDVTVLTVLHTNDVHSQIDSLPSNHPKFPNQGGFARRAAMIQQIRHKNANTILLDCGDIFQGSPYFNFYKGKLEIELMNQMRYDAATFGNHEFDNGVEELARRVGEAQFPFLNCNYNLEGSPLQSMVRPWQVVTRGSIKIGIIGVGIELSGLVDPSKSGNITWQSPVDLAENIAYMLKEKEGCHYVICLSHLGFKYDDDKISDCKLAAQSRSIDMILGGHTHTFLEHPVFITNKKGREVVINQAGWAGVRLGCIDVSFNNRTFAVVGCDSVNYKV